MLTWYTCVFLIDPVLYRSSIYHSGVCTSRKFVELFTKVSPKQYSVPRLRHDGVHYIHHLQFYAAPSKGSHYICSPDSPWHGACSLVRGKSKARYIQDKRLHSLTIKLTTCSKLNSSIVPRPPSISMFRFRFLFTISFKLWGKLNSPIKRYTIWTHLIQLNNNISNMYIMRSYIQMSITQTATY